MSLSEWIANIFGSMNTLVAVLLAVAIFSGLYIYTASRLLGARKDSLARIRQSLTIYSRLAGPLGILINRPTRTAVPQDLLIQLLQECKSADLLTRELHEQLDTFLSDQDESRLMTIHKLLNREMIRLMKERDELVGRLEKPGWGMGLWLLLKPAVPALALGAVILWSMILVEALGQPSAWTSPQVWCLWLSNIIATISFYRLLMDSRRRTHGVIYTLLHLLIVASALFNLTGDASSPYVLVTQCLLYMAGFRVTATRKRRERPYAGHPEVMEQFLHPGAEPDSHQEIATPSEPKEINSPLRTR
ncbi:hypothetical protein [Paenibacillus solani]|uniref:Uncharacterized protein n=1 Tax=Paenibacillus solani TaxID=1705565 RepID=A0A0M1N4B7_9BACL|nr:hypothetical protein [Paenibacillus solani]KOR76845.1 hypothetical protein AM231_23210 [Paenibacillus solani]